MDFISNKIKNCWLLQGDIPYSISFQVTRAGNMKGPSQCLLLMMGSILLSINIRSSAGNQNSLTYVYTLDPSALGIYAKYPLQLPPLSCLFCSVHYTFYKIGQYSWIFLYYFLEVRHHSFKSILKCNSFQVASQCMHCTLEYLWHIFMTWAMHL